MKRFILSTVAIAFLALPASLLANPTNTSPSTSIGGTTWAGSETLPGFGPLTFVFRSNGTVAMVDAADPDRGTVEGNWYRQGNAVTLRFADCEYRGNINGSSISGNAHFFAGDRNGERWTFQVYRR